VYYVYISTHNVEARKTHIYDKTVSKVLCGYWSPRGTSTISVDKDWIEQPDPDHTLCARCKRIALKNIGDVK